MTDREELIEEASKVIFRTRYPENRPDLAELAWESVSNMPEGVDIRDEASAALSVFEKAHTPTDDEREELTRVVGMILGESDDMQAMPDDAFDNIQDSVVAAVLADGFRRAGGE